MGNSSGSRNGVEALKVGVQGLINADNVEYILTARRIGRES